MTRFLPRTGGVLEEGLVGGLLQRYRPPHDQPPTPRNWYTFQCPADPTIRRAIFELIALAASEEAWEDAGIGALEAASLAAEVVTSMREYSMIGMVAAFATDIVPQGWIEMGTDVDAFQYPELRAVVPESWIRMRPGVGLRIFLPSLAGRSIVGAGLYDGPEETRAFAHAELAGVGRVTLTVDEIPSHTHAQDPHNHAQLPHTHVQLPHAHAYTAIAALPGAAPVQAGVGIQAAPLATAPFTAVNLDTTAANQPATAVNRVAGGGQSHDNRSPYLALRYYIFAGR